MRFSRFAGGGSAASVASLTLDIFFTARRERQCFWIIANTGVTGFAARVKAGEGTASGVKAVRCLRGRTYFLIPQTGCLRVGGVGQGGE